MDYTISICINNSSRRKSEFTLDNYKAIFNIPKVMVDDMQLANKRYAKLTNIGNTYTILFESEKKDDNVFIGMTGGAATIPFHQSVFGLEIMKNVKAKRLQALRSGDSITFYFDPERIEKIEPFIIPTRKIENENDKIVNGFPDKSSWGIAFSKAADAEIKKRFIEVLKTRVKDNEAN